MTSKVIQYRDRHVHLQEEQWQQPLETQLQQQDLFQNFKNGTDPSFWHPSLPDYYLNLTPFLTLVIFVASFLAILSIAIFGTTLSHLRRRVEVCYRGHCIFLCSLYPIISCAALVTILFPKSWLVCHTVMHLSFTFGGVSFQALCFRYVESQGSNLKEADGVRVSINTLPCCCCCSCLPTLVPTKGKLCLLRYMVRQMPFVQTCIMLVVNVIYIRDVSLYRNVNMYFIPFIICSILSGIWGLNITVRMVNAINTELNLMKKLFCLQLIMLLCKVQYMLLDNQLDRLVLDGDYPINHTIYKQTIINSLILCEMVLLSMLVQNAYKEMPAKREARTKQIL